MVETKKRSCVILIFITMYFKKEVIHAYTLTTTYNLAISPENDAIDITSILVFKGRIEHLYTIYERLFQQDP